jgi:hypothetical protein
MTFEQRAAVHPRHLAITLELLAREQGAGDERRSATRRRDVREGIGHRRVRGRVAASA